MVKDDRQNERCHLPEAEVPTGFIKRGPAFQLAAVALTAISLSATGFLMFRWLAPVKQVSAGTTSVRPAPGLFATWPTDRKPEVVLLLTGQQHGYLQPCGCSRPQLGGLERRYNFLQTLKERNWPVVAADLGDLAQHSGPQALLKYKYSMEALKLLKYTGVGLGLNEFAMPFFDAIGAYALNEHSPQVLNATLRGAGGLPPGIISAGTIAGGNGLPKIGIIGATARILATRVKNVDPSLVFDTLSLAIPPALKALSQNGTPELNLLLLGGELHEAKACAEQFPQFDVIVYATAEEEPPQRPDQQGKTLLIGLGHKGRYVGLVGAFRKPGGGLELHYQLVRMEEAYETPEAKVAGNPMLDLLQRYAEEVKNGNYLAQYPKTQHPLQIALGDSKYVGSERCQSCHPGAYQVWENTPHSHAYKTLTEAKRPSLRQFDGECIVCHVVGFPYNHGFVSVDKTPELMDNGCENCHGPGSLHIKHPHDAKILAAINPYKTQPNETPGQKTARMNRLNDSCQKCHDVDNDVNWNIKKWDKIVHMMTPEEKRQLLKK